jgi:hypothetical protein
MVNDLNNSFILHPSRLLSTAILILPLQLPASRYWLPPIMDSREDYPRWTPHSAEEAHADAEMFHDQEKAAHPDEYPKGLFQKMGKLAREHNKKPAGTTEHSALAKHHYFGTSSTKHVQFAEEDKSATNTTGDAQGGGR